MYYCMQNLLKEMNWSQRTIKKIFQKCGILIRKYNPSSSEELRRIKLLEYYNIDLVFDIGANTGQYATGIIDAGYKGKIVSFEPLSLAYNKLKKINKNQANWIIAPRGAIGARIEEIEINISENSVSSTLLNMLEAHFEGAPESKIVGKEKVQVSAIDDIYGDYIGTCKNIFIKIDVQGYEQEVLKGAQKLIDQTKGIEIEISLVPLYENQKLLLPEMLEYMNEKGFHLTSIVPAFTNQTNGKVLQCNAIFFRK